MHKRFQALPDSKLDIPNMFFSHSQFAFCSFSTNTGPRALRAYSLQSHRKLSLCKDGRREAVGGARFKTKLPPDDLYGSDVRGGPEHFGDFAQLQTDAGQLPACELRR